jgi:hypothetical protein
MQGSKLAYNMLCCGGVLTRKGKWYDIRTKHKECNPNKGKSKYNTDENYRLYYGKENTAQNIVK